MALACVAIFACLVAATCFTDFYQSSLAPLNRVDSTLYKVMFGLIGEHPSLHLMFLKTVLYLDTLLGVQRWVPGLHKHLAGLK